MHDVCAATAREIIIVVAAVDDIGGPTAIELVPAGAAIEQGPGIALAGLDDVVPGIAVKLLSRGCDPETAVDRIVTVSAMDHIGAGTALYIILARAALKRVVVSRGPEEQVMASAHVIVDRPVVVEVPGARRTRVDRIGNRQMLTVDRDVLDVEVAIAIRIADIIDEGEIEARYVTRIGECIAEGLEARRVGRVVEFDRAADLLSVDQKLHLGPDAINDRAVARHRNGGLREFRDRIGASGDGVVASAGLDRIVAEASRQHVVAAADIHQIGRGRTRQYLARRLVLAAIPFCDQLLRRLALGRIAEL